MNKLLKKLIIVSLLSLLLFPFIYTISLSADSTLYVWSSNNNTIQTSISLTSEKNNSLNLESESAILIEQNSGQILYEHNIHEQLRPASVTKLMTILLMT